MISKTKKVIIKDLVLLVFLMMIFVKCQNFNEFDNEKAIKKINNLVNHWHENASRADMAFFDFIADEGIYIGTATEEVWTKEAFLNFAKPYFDKGEAWDFKPYDRNIYFSENKDIVWFDERLETWMGVCRGSGILIREQKAWKLHHYNLSMSVPNECVNEVISIIKKSENAKNELP